MSLWGLIYGQYITKLEIKRFEKSSKQKLPIQMVWARVVGYRLPYNWLLSGSKSVSILLLNLWVQLNRFYWPVEFWKFHRSVKHFVYAVTSSKLIQKNLRILAIRIVSYCVQSWRFGNQLRSAANITISTTLTLMYYVVFFSAKWKIKYSWL